MDNNFNLDQLDNIEMHYIIGPGRSGTTLLVNIFSCHENCFANPEINFFLYFYKKYHKINRVSARLIKDLKAYCHEIILSKNELFQQYVDLDYLSLLKIGQPTSYAQITKLMFFVFHSKTKMNDLNKVTTLIDKHPFYTYQVEKILSVFPEAKFIGLVRDYHAFVSSNRKSKQPYQLKLSVFYFSTVWKYYVKRMFSEKQKFPSHILLVKYEDWVRKNEDTLTQMLTHLHLEQKESLAFSYKRAEAILNWYKENPNIYLSSRDINVLKNLSKPVNTSKTDAWKEKLSPLEIKKCDYISRKTGEELEYFAQFNKIGPLQSTWFFLTSLTGRIRVATFFFLNSITIQHFLTIKIRIFYLNLIKKNRVDVKNNENK